MKGTFMARENAENLHDLLLMKLQVLYGAEQEFTKALPKMAEAATDEDLKMAFQSHLKETERHIQRLNKAFEELDEKPEILESEAVQGLVADTQWCIDNIENSQALDTALTAAGQNVEHFEIAGYGSAASWAETMGHTEVKNLLGETLEEEKAADEKLNGLALAKINEAANDMETEEIELEEKGFFGKMEPTGI
jgi:ferritin-like metal-binding protein YciE